MNRAPSATMIPHSGVGGRTPRPMKRQAGGIEDRPAEVERDLHRHRWQLVGQQYAQHHDVDGCRRRRAASTQPALRRTFTSARGEAHVERQVDDGRGDDDVLDACCPARPPGAIASTNSGKAIMHVDETADPAIEPAADDSRRSRR